MTPTCRGQSSGVEKGRARLPHRHPRVDSDGGSRVDGAAASSSADERLLHTDDEALRGGNEWREAQPARRKDDSDNGFLPGMGWQLQAVMRRLLTGRRRRRRADNTLWAGGFYTRSSVHRTMPHRPSNRSTALGDRVTARWAPLAVV
jgi:hypothetical protein